MSKRHTIRSLNDLCDLVNEDNYECLSENLKQWLIGYYLTMKTIKSKLPANVIEGKKNSELASGGFVWIDDGKNDIKGMTIESGGKKIDIEF